MIEYCSPWNQEHCIFSCALSAHLAPPRMILTESRSGTLFLRVASPGLSTEHASAVVADTLSKKTCFVAIGHCPMVTRHVLWPKDNVLWPQNMSCGHRTLSYGHKTCLVAVGHCSVATRHVLWPYDNVLWPQDMSCCHRTMGLVAIGRRPMATTHGLWP